MIASTPSQNKRLGPNTANICITMELMELGYKKAAIKDVYNVRAGFRSTADRVNFTEEAWKKMKPELIRILDKNVRADEEALRIQLTNEQSRRYKKKMARLRTILDAFLSTPVAGSLTREEKLVLSFNQDSSLGIRLMPDIAMRNDSEANTTRDLILHWPQIRERLAQAASNFKQEIINIYPRNRFIWHFPDEHLSPTYAIFHLRCTQCNTLMSYTAMLEHPCLSQMTHFTDHTVIMYEIYRTLCPYIDAGYTLLKSLDLPLTTSQEYFETLGRKLVCTVCAPDKRQPMTWLELIIHYVNLQVNMYWKFNEHGVSNASAHNLGDEDIATYIGRTLVEGAEKKPRIVHYPMHTEVVNGWN